MPISTTIDRGTHPNGKITRERWQLLPLAIRKRWWKETAYGDHPERASVELMTLIIGDSDQSRLTNTESGG